MDDAERLSGKVALVTGATGFIGATLARRLRASGVIVHGASRRPQPSDDACDRWCTADLTDAATAERVVHEARPDVVFHLACLVAGDRSIDRVLPMLHANLVAAVNVLTAASRAGRPRVVLAGSLEEPQPDGTWPVPQSPYAAAKLAAGAYARMFHALYGLPTVWLRLFMVYGPAQHDVRKLVPYVITSLLRGESPALSSGTRPVDWIHVDDVVDALVAASVAAGVEGKTIDVGSGELVTVRDVVDRLGALIGSGVAPRFGAIPDRVLEAERVADTGPAAKLLGWRPRVPLGEGLCRTVEWYRQHGVDDAGTEGGGAMKVVLWAADRAVGVRRSRSARGGVLSGRRRSDRGPVQVTAPDLRGRCQSVIALAVVVRCIFRVRRAASSGHFATCRARSLGRNRGSSRRGP